MRDAFSLTAFYQALDAWTKHEQQYFETLAKAKQGRPSPEQLVNYRNLWLEGYLEALSDAASDQLPI